MMLLPKECIRISRKTCSCVCNLAPQTIGGTQAYNEEMTQGGQNKVL